MAVGAAFQWVCGDSAAVVNPPTGSVKLGVDCALGPYSKAPGTPGGTDGAVTFFGITLEAFQDAVAGMFVDSAWIDFVYDDGAGTVTATIKPGSVTPTELSFDPATQAELDVVSAALAAHLADTVDAHDASAVSFVPAAGIAATDVQAAIVEDAGDLAAHLADTSDAHDASAISLVPTGDVAATDVQGAIAELASEKATTGSVATVAGDLTAHLVDAVDAHDASAISNVPAGTVASTDVQGAINELDTEKIATTVLDTDGTLAANSDAKVATQKATKTYADAKVLDSIADADTTRAPSRNAVFDALALKQPLDADLTQIAGLTPGANDFLEFVDGVWTNRTPTQVTAVLDLATTTAKGLMSAADKLLADNIWFDAQADAGIIPGAAAATNLAAFNAWYSTAPNGATLFFAPGTYDFSGELTLNRDIRIRFLGAGRGRSILRTTSVTANLFNQTVAGFYISFVELGFGASVNKSAGGAIVASANNAYLEVRHCEFQNQFNGVDVSSTALNVGMIFDCQFNTPATGATGGRQIRINGSAINGFIQCCTVNVTGADCTGIEINASGALQVSTCDFIGGRNTLLVNSTGVVSALFFTNCFFDQATLGSTVKFIGAGTGGVGQPAASRIKFVQCGFANGAAGLACVEIAGTGSGTSIPEAVDFLLCDFYNNGFGGTTTGVLATGVRGFDLTGCRIAGCTFGVDVTSYSAAGVTNFNINGCTIGPTENFAGNGTGIRINAGSFTYGSSSVKDNDLSGNTTAPLVNNGNFAGTFDCDGNQGLPNGKLAIAPQAVPTAATYLGGLAIPPNSLTTKTHFRITLLFKNTTATASNTTVRIKWGTAAGTGDANIHAQVHTGTALAGFAKILLEVSVTVLNAATGTIEVHAMCANGVQAATGFDNTANRWSNTTTATLNTTTAANFLGIELLQSVAAIHNLISAQIEVVNQGY